MSVITISRELGSEGSKIGHMVAESLSYKLYDKHHVEEILKQYGMIEFDEVYQTAASFWSRFDAMDVQMVKMLNKTILAFAQRDNTVILGRGGFAILQAYQNVLNIRIQAPFAYRVKNLMRIEDIRDKKTAEKRILENDRIRESFIQTFYAVSCDAANLFNLVIDTSKVPSDMAARWIIETVHQMDKEEARVKGLSTRDIEVEPVLEKAVTELQL